MKKQISGMEMAIIAVMAMVALIVVYVAGTRLSEQPIHRYSGACPRDRA